MPDTLLTVPARTIDVVVPVHGAPQDLARCLESVQRWSDLRTHRLLLIDDANRDREVVDQLDGTRSDDGHIEILRNPRRLGFVRSANLGMRLGSADVVLLNSDTQVTEGWIDKLQDAAYSRPEIGTVTPFSNNATLCSLPIPFANNEIPQGHDVDSFAGVVERRSQRLRPVLPTGVGFCLFLKRAMLERVGYFDEAAFGEGYGEENDLCLRARAAGFEHVLDDATFVFHRGGASFGARSDPRSRRAQRVLRRRYPGYWREIARFMRDDPLAPIRQRVLDVLTPRRDSKAIQTRRDPSGPRRVLHLVHGWPPTSRGGTELYARWLAVRQAQHRDVTAFARLADSGLPLGEVRERWDDGVRVQLVVNNFVQRDPRSRNALADRRLEARWRALLESFRPDLVHVHHLAGHTVKCLERISRRVPVLYQLQDWWALCARTNLCDAHWHRCRGPSLGRCSRCFSLTALPPATLTNRLLHAWRRRCFRRALRRPEGFLMGSRFIEQSYREQGLLRADDRLWVRPYGVPLANTPPPQRARPGSGAPLRFGFVGAVLPHKGVHLAVEAFHGLDPDRVQLRVWGDTSTSRDYAERLEAARDPNTVTFDAPFPESEKARHLAALDCLIVPSIGLESFGLVAREALAVGTPVIAAAGSALDELLAELAGECRFDPESPQALQALVTRIADDPAVLGRWHDRLPHPRGADAHAEEVEAIYLEVLHAHRARRRG